MDAEKALQRVKKARKEKKQYEQNLAELVGREKQILDSMEEKFGVTSLVDCKGLLDTIEKNILNNNNKLNKMMEQLDEQQAATIS